MTTPPRSNDLGLLHPVQKTLFVSLAHYLERDWQDGKTKTHFKVFEAWRSPLRQAELFKQGSVTKADAWQSAHQFGLAVDFVPWTVNGWSWDEHHDYDWLRERAYRIGLATPIAWDRCHVESQLWPDVRRALYTTLK